MIMKRLTASIVFVAIVALAAVAQADSKFLARHESKRLPRIKPPKVKVRVLENGVRMYLLEDHTIPVVKVGALLKVGNIYEPADKVGLAALTGSLMRSGGAGDLKPEEFDKALDDLGSKLGAGIGQETGTAGLEILSGDLKDGLALLFDMLFKPRFDPGRLAVAKHKMLEALRREDDDPGSLAGYKYSQLVYGKFSPWARRPDRRTISNVSVGDIRDFHAKYYRTDNLILTAAGDFKVDDFVKVVEKMTKGASDGEIAFPEVEQVKLVYESKAEDIGKPLTQAFIRMGHLSIKRWNPDKYALFLADDILGASGFMSRLVKDVRAKRGMAYAIWSSVAIGTDYGLFTIGVNTKANNAQGVIGIVREHMERMVNGDITQEELDLAKQSILSQLIFQFDMPFKVVSQQARFHFYGYPENYWKIYSDRIASCTLDQVKAAAKKYFRPGDLEILIVGPAISFGKDGK